MTEWLFPRLQAASDGASNFDITPPNPICVVWHTTEITTAPVDGAWVAKWASPSHILACPFEFKVYQCVSLDRGAKALWNDPGGVHTNLRETVWQIEVHMLSPNGSMERPDLNDEQYMFLAREVLVPLYKESVARGNPLDLDDTPDPGPIPMSATVNAPQRFSGERWNSFRGNCGHRHVPENDHWDAGTLDLKKIVRFAKQILAEESRPEPEVEMPSYLVYGTNQVVWAVYPTGVVRQLGGAEFAFLASRVETKLSSSGGSEDDLMAVYAAR